MSEIKENEAISITTQNENDKGKDKPSVGKKDENTPMKPGPDMDGDFDWEDSVVVIKDENGKEIEFVVLDELTHNGGKYLLVVESNLLDDDEAEAVILKEVGEKEEDMVYEELNDQEFEVLAELFDQRLEDYDIEF